MKFRSKTGEAFEDIVAAWFAFCDQKCRECPISCWNNEDKTRCDLYCHAHPHEAARLMGYEVVEDDAVEGMCCDCAHGGPCCSPDENTNCADRKEDGTCWVPYTKETTMQCYRDGGCGPYEGRSCTECPASKPDYKQRKMAKTNKPTSEPDDLFLAFLKFFKDELEKTFGEMGFEDQWLDVSGTGGWANALKATSKLYMPEIWALWNRLDWWASDLLDGWLIDCAKYMDLYKEEDTDKKKPYICQRLGIDPGQPFLLHGYPNKDYPPLVWTDGQIRRYSPDGDHGFKVGGRAVCWMMEHPEAIEPLQGYTPEEVAFKGVEIDQFKAIESDRVKEVNMDKPRICEVLGVEVGEVFTADTPYGQFKRCVVDEEGQILNTGINVLCYIINHPDRIIRKPRWTEQEVEDAKAIKRVLKATGIRRNRYDNIYATGELIVDTLLDSEAFPSLQPDTAVTIDEIIGGAQ